MVMNSIWEPLDKKDLLEGAKIITSTWTCKKKSNGIYHDRLNSRGFEQIAGKHFDPSSTAVPVTKDMTIRAVPVLMMLENWITRMYVLLKGNFEDGEEIFMKVPQSMEHHY